MQLTLPLTLGLAACGGGFYVGIDDDGWDLPPQVSLVASASIAAPGQALRLAAAASDDWGVDRVQFHRLDSDGQSTLLGTDRTPPYEWDTIVPETGADRVRYFARAFDHAGQSGDSTFVVVTVRR
jgi:hypothetical protein